MDEVLAIAHHDALRGDSVLGENEMLRFLPDRFDHLGRPLDSMGSICPDSACPHCRHKLPSGFLHQPHHIFSVVGEQSAGKSYYLAVLTKTLPATLFTHFQVYLTDADPIGNLQLNTLRNTLFSAETPQAAQLAKTQLTSEMYEPIQLQGWPEPLRFPKPFVYTASKRQSNVKGFSIVFYDNAGEHFRPNVDIVKNPGAKHVAAASGILFLFDPFHSPDFRRRMRNADAKDPQFNRTAIDQQGVLLATMSDRIKAIQGMPIGEQIKTPLAFIAGKCDAWQHLLGENPWSEPIRDGVLDLNAIHRNSASVRRLLMGICPETVAGAEAISDNVLYFPVSSFGHTPLEVKAKSGEPIVVPDPAQLKPLMSEVPPLWLLSQIPGTRAFVPSRSIPVREVNGTTVTAPKPCVSAVGTPPAVERVFDFKAPCTPMVGDLNRLICAFLVAHDGHLSDAEEKWLEENIGPGSIEEIVNVAQSLDYEELHNQIARMTSHLVIEEQEWLQNARPFWSQLVHCDGEAGADLDAWEWICGQIDAAIKASA